MKTHTKAVIHRRNRVSWSAHRPFNNKEKTKKENGMSMGGRLRSFPRGPAFQSA